MAGLGQGEQISPGQQFLEVEAGFGHHDLIGTGLHEQHAGRSWKTSREPRCLAQELEIVAQPLHPLRVEGRVEHRGRDQFPALRCRCPGHKAGQHGSGIRACQLGSHAL